MSVPVVENQDEYNKYLSSNKTTIVLFSAEWAEQCKQILDVMTELSKQLTSLQFLNVKAEELPEISLKCQVEAVPTVIFFKDNKAIDRIDGIDVSGMTAKCKKLAGESRAAAGSLEDRLKALISKANVMVFMKGDRNAPRCGFSKQLILILNETGVPYETFDILQDEEVRQGLKTYSDWPTYPQVYVKSELIGGLDIIKEMLANGELQSSLNA